MANQKFDIFEGRKEVMKTTLGPPFLWSMHLPERISSAWVTAG